MTSQATVSLDQKKVLFIVIFICFLLLVQFNAIAEFGSILPILVSKLGPTPLSTDGLSSESTHSNRDSLSLVDVHEKPVAQQKQETVAKDMSLEESMRNLCKDIQMDPDAKNEVALIPFLFCQMYPLVYKRTMTQKEDRLRSHYVPKSGTVDHYQMAFEQYMAIVSTIMTIPRHPEESKQGPSVLVIGCGADTPIYAHLMTYLEGTVDFVDDNVEWAKICEQNGADKVHVVVLPL